LSAADRRSAGSSVASSPKIIELTVAVEAPSTTASRAIAGSTARSASARGRPRPGHRRHEDRPEADAVADDATERRHQGADQRGGPVTSAIADARPGPTPTIPSTRTGMYGRLIWIATNEMPKIAKIRRVQGR
jgi:hypothetical protein